MLYVPRCRFCICLAWLLAASSYSNLGNMYIIKFLKVFVFSGIRFKEIRATSKKNCEKSGLTMDTFEYYINFFRDDRPVLLTPSSNEG